ncbi:hypothetical protein BDV28DRAFT_160882 [Aspergillus coremiiformis]|uniref:RING-type domain-containing protein n=1 Tax=Aspergillus coremiiformis TaxID=138285 RepID=A0A5N6YU53_9EURO|nr:hypothetical protein BDV28DRAFT_160882 [Aspergillus coremiiformis]
MSAKSPSRGPGLRDLEKELVCSICTELLYQPLTLLDCLHTFCGSCLKEWFSAQASRHRSSSSVRFTCPSCRAIVRETRPNATVTTLLDMVLTANPDRAKPEAEKEEIAQKYKPGQCVFPTTASPENGTDEEDGEDRRLMEDVRDLSLRESRTRTREHRSARSTRPRRGQSPDRNGRREDGRSARHHGQRSALSEASEHTRRIEHQSSLRSLLSLSDTETMQEEILRQILEEGLLDDIDMDNLGPSQEEELSERIADAYRRRHRLRSRSQQRNERREVAHASSRPRVRSQSVQSSQPTSASRGSPAHPPVSRPYLLQPLVPHSGVSGHQRRLSDQGSSRRRTSPIPVNSASSSEANLRPAARSSSDMIADRSRGSQTARVRETDSALRSRRATASEQPIPNIWVAGADEREGRRQRPARQSADSPTSGVSFVRSSRNASFSLRSEQHVANSPTSTALAPEINSPARPEGRSRPSSSRSNVSQPIASYTEPCISCDRCGRLNIQYELHKKCPLCKDGNYHLCLQCYRLGHGCLDWPGFGISAKAYFDRIRASSNGHPAPPQESQHILLSLKYSRPSDTARWSARDGREITNENPSRRLQTGLFCDICQASADKCFWKCNQCNEGDWGFCNKCVNEGKCCTHALLPICRVPQDSPLTLATPTGTGDVANGSATSLAGTETLKVLSFSTNCDICANPIPASTLRFHCLQCNEGDYDICANCYLKLVAMAKIRKENGHNGWRRCLRGHRMVVVGFEDHEEGQKRVIVRDLVGGRALKDEHLQPSSPPVPPSLTRTLVTGSGTVPPPEVGTGDWSWKEGAERRKKASRIRAPWSSTPGDRTNSTPEPSTPTTPTPNASSSRRFPPDGGVGLVVHALWSWYPEGGVNDELMFPRGAEITEAENINDDWYWGCYAGSTGLFPGTHVFVVGEIA